MPGQLLDRVQVIDRDVEEPLNLGRVQVEREDAVGPGAGDEVGDQLRRDGHAALVLAVLAGVPVVRHHRGDPGRAGALERVQHDEKFHRVLIHGRARRLHDEDIAAADVFVDADHRLAVGEGAEVDVAQRHAEVLSDGLGQGPVRPPAEDLQLVGAASADHVTPPRPGSQWSVIMQGR